MNSLNISNIQSKIIIEKGCFTLAAFVVAGGLAAICGWISNVILQFTDDSNFWNSMVYTGPLMNILVATFVCINKYCNFKYRNHFFEPRSYNPELLYLICLPLVVFINICMCISAINDYNMLRCTRIGRLPFSISCCLYYLSVLLFLTQCNGISDDGEVWIVNLTNMVTFLLIIVSQGIYILFNISIEQVGIYGQFLINLKRNNSCNFEPKSLAYAVQSLLERLGTINEKMIVLFGLACIIFIFEPFLRHYYLLQKHKLNYFQENPCIHSESRPQNFPKTTLILLFIEVQFFIVHFIFYFHHEVWSTYFFICSELLIYVVLIVVCVIIIREISGWKYKPRKDVKVNKTIVWLGLVGQLMYSFAIMTNAILNLSKETTVLAIIVLMNNMVQVPQNLLQSILESILLESVWKGINENRNQNVLLSFIFLATINLLLIFTNIIILDNYFVKPPKDDFPLKLFMKFIHSFGIIFCILQRVNGMLIFLSYIKHAYSSRKTNS